MAIGLLGYRRPAVWFSADGEQWRLVSPGQEALAWPLTLNSVTAGDGGYVAVGTGLGAPRFLCPSGNENCAYDEAVVLTSVDGKTWVRSPAHPSSESATRGVQSGTKARPCSRSLRGDRVPSR